MIFTSDRCTLEVGHSGIWSRDINIWGTVLWIYLHFLWKIRFFIPCSVLIRVSDISICHVLYCPYTPTPISSRTFWQSAVGFVKPLLIVALRSTKNTEFISQVSWRTIRSISGFIVIVNYAVTSRRLQEWTDKQTNSLSVNIFTRWMYKRDKNLISINKRHPYHADIFYLPTLPHQKFEFYRDK